MLILEDTIYIAAPRSAVWDVTIDIERWPEWLPTMTAVERLDAGPFGPGSRARIKQPAQPWSVWEVTAFEDGASFTWESRRTGLWFKGTHALSDDGDGTHSVLRIEAGGWLAVLMGPLLRPAVGKALREESACLKRRCETQAATQADMPA